MNAAQHLSVLQRLFRCDHCRDNCDRLTNNNNVCSTCVAAGRQCVSRGAQLLNESRTTLWTTLLSVQLQQNFAAIIANNTYSHPFLNLSMVAFAARSHEKTITSDQRAQGRTQYALLQPMIYDIPNNIQSWVVTNQNGPAYFLSCLFYGATLIHMVAHSKPDSPKIQAITGAFGVLMANWGRARNRIRAMMDHPDMREIKQSGTTAPNDSTVDHIDAYRYLRTYINNLPADEWGQNTARVKNECLS
ncbi:hypothetical protein KCU99_g9424, partial [Aureobasidium melanogenum]